MEPINILDARNRLSRLVSAASAGEEVVISKRGVPVARLVPATDGRTAMRSASRAAMWLTMNAVPKTSGRRPEDLDAQIAAEREGWEWYTSTPAS